MTPQVNVMLFVDLPEATPWQREQFHDRMRERDWRPMPDHANTFCTRVRGPASDREIIRLSEDDAAVAAEASGLSQWEAVCVLSG